MKIFIVLLTLITSLNVFAGESCIYRFNPHLSVTLSNTDAGRTIIWDTANVCTVDGICTEIYPGAFKVRIKNLTPRGELGAFKFRIRSISVRDDLGNRYRSRSSLGSFIRQASFSSVVIAEPNLTIRWKGKSYVMDCGITN